MQIPTFRSGTKIAVEALSTELNLPFHINMQDWSYTVANPNDIEKYLEHYRLTIDTDKKFVLMEMILQSINDQTENADFLKYCKKVKPILQADFKMHEYTIFYWSCFEIQNIADTWKITPFLRELWQTKPRRKQFTNH